MAAGSGLFVCLFQPTDQFFVHVFGAFDADAMADHRVETARCFELAGRSNPFQVDADIRRVLVVG